MSAGFVTIRPASWLRRNGERLLVVVPAAFVAVFLIYPLGRVFVDSLASDAGLLAPYREALDDPLFREATLRTVVTCALVSVSTLVIAFPVAYEVTRPAVNRLRRIVLVAIVLSLWLSILVRTYTWLLLLQRTGPVNEGVQWLGISDEPMELVRNNLGIYIGMTHILLPFMVLTLVPAMRAIDPRYLQAAAGLGASRAVILRRVLIPLSRSGAVAGLLLTFILGLGFFVTPQILGDPSDPFVSQLIAQEITRTRDFERAAAMGVLLASLVAVVYLAAMSLLDPRRLGHGRRA